LLTRLENPKTAATGGSLNDLSALKSPHFSMLWRLATALVEQFARTPRPLWVPKLPRTASNIGPILAKGVVAKGAWPARALDAIAQVPGAVVLVGHVEVA